MSSSIVTVLLHPISICVYPFSLQRVRWAILSVTNDFEQTYGFPFLSQLTSPHAVNPGRSYLSHRWLSGLYPTFTLPVRLVARGVAWHQSRENRPDNFRCCGRPFPAHRLGAYDHPLGRKILAICRTAPAFYIWQRDAGLSMCVCLRAHERRAGAVSPVVTVHSCSWFVWPSTDTYISLLRWLALMESYISASIAGVRAFFVHFCVVFFQPNSVFSVLCMSQSCSRVTSEKNKMKNRVCSAFDAHFPSLQWIIERHKQPL